MALLRAIRFIDGLLPDAQPDRQAALLIARMELVLEYIAALRQPSSGRKPDISQQQGAINAHRNSQH